MKKSTLIRSDKPHAVKMTAGSNVAQSKGPAKAKEPDQPAPLKANIQKVAPTKAPKVQRTASPTSVAKTVRAKASLTRLIEAPAKPTKPKAAPAKATKPKARSTSPKSSAKVEAPAPTEPIWEQNNPIKARMEQLRARNAELAEQLQRLQKTPTARGK